MNENQDKQSDLVDTTDCLEAVGVFRGWKNFLFVIVACCLLLLQISFWLVDTGCFKAENEAEAAETALPVITPPPAKELVVPLKEKQTRRTTETPNKTEKAAEQIAAEPDQPAEAVPKESPQQASSGFGIQFEHLAWVIRFVNFLLILAAALYCLTMLFSLKVSLLARLGGINHISRAFFLSLTFLVFLLPWQKFFAGVIVGVIYTPEELLSSCAAETGGIFRATLYYLRFTGYWLLVVLLLILSQLRSIRWTKAILRRLEVI